MGNQRYQVPLLIYINQAGEVSHLVRGSKVLRDRKYLMSSFKRAAKAVGIWTENNCDVKNVNSLYTVIYGSLNFKINNGFDLLSWSYVVKYLYTKKVYIIGELN